MADDDPRGDDELVRSARVDPDGFAVFYRRHVHALLGYFFRRTGDAELAADLTAETFAAALDGAHRFRPERGPAVAWLYTTEGGLGATAQGELVERVPELLPAGGTVVGRTTSQLVERSEVLHLPGREAEAYPIGAALGIQRVREVTRAELADAAAPGSAVIAVVLGADRMR